MGPTIVFIKEEDVVIVAWILTMHECELSITLTNENESSILAHSNKLLKHWKSPKHKH
jgi:hypothetical protein